MFEKVNPSHPDKIADRIAGALVDLAYKKQHMPRVAIEVLIGHGECVLNGEASVEYSEEDISAIVKRITNDNIEYNIKNYIVSQDPILAKNQEDEIRCGDNGIFKGTPFTAEQLKLTHIVDTIYKKIPYDGKYILDFNSISFFACQSHLKEYSEDGSIILDALGEISIDENCGFNRFLINPLGEWTGGLSVDTGCTNRKLGSDMGNSVTGGGLHGKDLSKADVAINIFLSRFAQSLLAPVEAICAIGDTHVEVLGAKLPYSYIVTEAGHFIDKLGGFEKFAEYGLLHPALIIKTTNHESEENKNE